MEPTLYSQPTQPAAPSPKSQSKKRWVMIGGIGVLFILVAGIAFYNFMLGQEKENESMGGEISITDSGVDASTILIAKGTDITWTNDDDMPHRIVSDDANAGLDSGEALSKGDSYTHTFEEAGTYSYYDPTDITGLKGTVIVQ